MLDDVKNFKENPTAKTLSMRFVCLTEEVAKRLYVELSHHLNQFGSPAAGILPNDQKDVIGTHIVVAQVNVLDRTLWPLTMDAAFELMSMNSSKLEELGFEYDEVCFVGAHIYGTITVEEQALFNKLSSFTFETKSTIISALSEVVSLKNQVAKFQEQLAGLKVYNSQIVHTNSLMNLLRRMADKLGMEDDDFIEQSFVTIQ